MSRSKRATTHLTFANVAAGLALVVALGSGGAYAAGLAKNSVGSKQIVNGSIAAKDIKKEAVTGDQVKNGSVAGADVADGSLTGADVAGDSLTGAQINEGSLGSVPNADALGGNAASSYARTTPVVGGSFSTATPLALTVSGYGTYRLKCNASTVAFEDFPTFQSSDFGAVSITSASSPLSSANTVLFNQDASAGLYGNANDRIHVDAIYRSANGAKSIHLDLWGWITGSGTCTGFIEGQILR